MGAPVLRVSHQLGIPLDEIEISAMRAGGPGGQHVNKAATAIHLRFDVRASSLPADVKRRLLASSDARRTLEGVLVIKAQRHRSQELNRVDALERLRELVRRAAVRAKPRLPTKPTRASKLRRLERKSRRGRLKALRRTVDD